MNSNTVNQPRNVTGQMQMPTIHIDADPDEMDGLAAEMGMVASSREVPAWASSLLVHVLVLMALWSVAGLALPDRQTVINSIMEEVDEESYKFIPSSTERTFIIVAEHIKSGTNTPSAESPAGIGFGGCVTSKADSKINLWIMVLLIIPIIAMFSFYVLFLLH
ncbi:MAG: hypothetical protein IIB03_04305 [Acidobacteria bacterium]|nr:hypothetical protein [Acidobacteriota bacterium]